MMIDTGTTGGGVEHGGRILQGKIHAPLIETLAVVGGEIDGGTCHHQDQVSETCGKAMTEVGMK